MNENNTVLVRRDCLQCVIGGGQSTGHWSVLTGQTLEVISCNTCSCMRYRTSTSIIGPSPTSLRPYCTYLIEIYLVCHLFNFLDVVINEKHFSNVRSLAICFFFWRASLSVVLHAALLRNCKNNLLHYFALTLMFIKLLFWKSSAHILHLCKNQILYCTDNSWLTS